MTLYGQSDSDASRIAAEAYAQQVIEQEIAYGVRQPDNGCALYGAPPDHGNVRIEDAVRFASPFIDKFGNVW